MSEYKCDCNQPDLERVCYTCISKVASHFHKLLGFVKIIAAQKDSIYPSDNYIQAQRILIEIGELK